jgi:hypothetical protein
MDPFFKLAHGPYMSLDGSMKRSYATRNYDLCRCYNLESVITAIIRYFKGFDLLMIEALWPVFTELGTLLKIKVLFSVFQVIAVRVYNFDDCVEAAEELKGQIAEAKADLKKKGLKF